MITAASLTICLLTLSWGAPDAPPAAVQHTVVQAGGADDNTLLIRPAPGDVTVLRATAQAARLATPISQDEEKEKKIRLPTAPKGPEVWIGVRVTPVPEALAAHLQRQGLMIANVAVGSPADKAGVERFDVVVSFAGQPIGTMEDLVAAIRDCGAGNAAEMVVLRGGQQKTLTVTPASGGDISAWTYKYEEPDVAEIEPLKQYFGHRFRLGPGGRGIVVPHGRLTLPDDIEKLLEQAPGFDWDQWSQWWEDWGRGFRFDIDIDRDSVTLFGEDEEEYEGTYEVRLSITEDGQTLVIERHKDGTIDVERQQPDGQRSSASYSDIDELKQKDREAYRTFKRFIVPPGGPLVLVKPELKDLGARQKQFQLELKAQLEKAREELERTMEKGHAARRQAEQFLKRLHEGETRTAGDTASGYRESAVLRIDDGRITLEIEKDGVSRRYEFDSAAEFERREPELYQRFRKHLENAGDAGGAEQHQGARLPAPSSLV